MTNAEKVLNALGYRLKIEKKENKFLVGVHRAVAGAANPPQKRKLHCCYTMRTPRGDGNIPADFGLMMGSRLLPETPRGVADSY